MASIIRIKRSTGSNAPASLANAELAFAEGTGALYVGVGTGGANGTATTISQIASANLFASQAASRIYASPAASTGAPTFRALVAGDLPAHSHSISDVTGLQAAIDAKASLTGATFTGAVALGTGSTVTASPASNSNDTSVATTSWVRNLGLGSGSVTSVALDLPSIFSVSGSPVTTTGTLSASLLTQHPHLVFAGPSAGSTALAPNFRQLVSADIPTLLAAKISDFDTQVRTSRLDQMAAPTADVALNSRKITGLATPTANADAATKAYVDSVRDAAISGLDVKQSVRAATTTNITMFDPDVEVDGVIVSVNDRVLVKNQTTASQNGIYLVGGGAWTRVSDMDQNAEISPGVFVFVEEGTVNADSGWVLTNNGTVTIGTTALAFSQFSGAGQISVGTGLSKSGNTISLDATLAQIAGVTTAADQLIYATGADAFATTSLTSFGRSLIDDTTQSAARTTLGLGSMATQTSSSVDITGGTIDGTTITGAGISGGSIDNVTIDGGSY